jgi:hypothetical protein
VFRRDICVVPAGGFAPGRTQWVHPKRAGFFLPSEVLSVAFRGKLTGALKGLFRQKKLAFHGSLAWLAEPPSFARFLQTLHQHKWVVDGRKPFGGQEHGLHYLACYTHRVAISNHRLIAMEDGKVTFRWKDYAHGSKKRKMTLAAEEFIRRFLLHVLPKGLVRIRHYGWMANRCRTQRAALCRKLLNAAPPPVTLPHKLRPAVSRLRRHYRSGGNDHSPRANASSAQPKACSRHLVTTSLLASHAGRVAPMLHVCGRGPRCTGHSALRSPSAPICFLHAHQNSREAAFYAPDQPPQKYQNQIRNTYAPVPRPPQPQAAHFKRLYRN